MPLRFYCPPRLYLLQESSEEVEAPDEELGDAPALAIPKPGPKGATRGMHPLLPSPSQAPRAPPGGCTEPRCTGEALVPGMDGVSRSVDIYTWPQIGAHAHGIWHGRPRQQALPGWLKFLLQLAAWSQRFLEVKLGQVSGKGCGADSGGAGRCMCRCIGGGRTLGGTGDQCVGPGSEGGLAGPHKYL